jgi:hypothetical protein
MAGRRASWPETDYGLHHRMKNSTSNLAIAEPPVRAASPQRERAGEREPVHSTELAMLRERVRRMRLPRGEFMPNLSR